MKTKKVVYQDMFNPDKVFEAPNKPMWTLEFSEWKVNNWIKESSRCLCMHPNIVNDFCTYGKCRHHYADHNRSGYLE